MTIDSNDRSLERKSIIAINNRNQTLVLSTMAFRTLARQPSIGEGGLKRNKRIFYQQSMSVLECKLKSYDHPLRFEDDITTKRAGGKLHIWKSQTRKHKH